MNAANLSAGELNGADLIVVGSGVSGLYAALSAAARGRTVTLLTKDALENSNSWYAQGGLSAVGPEGIAAGDSITSHVADTLTAGAQLNDAETVALMCSSAWAHVQELVSVGAHFDTDASGEFARGLEAAHSHPRILHAGGDATGRSLASALITACRRQEAAGGLTIREHVFVTQLITAANPHADPSQAHAATDQATTRVIGVRTLGPEGSREELFAPAVLLATGGSGQLYAATTNPAGATGDGAALAYRAGAALGDLEFIQFHPTLVSPGGFMVSEAVRGEGAILINEHGERFMQEIHPDAELAPRDVVARAIHAVRAKGGTVHLDARAVEATRGPGFLARRFPSITAELGKLGYDLGLEPVPVTPAAHYIMGGILTDDLGASTLPGLYAAGECANTGVHGANRLASNSLLEGLVFAWRMVVSLPMTPEIGDLANSETNRALTKVIVTQPRRWTEQKAESSPDSEADELQNLAQLQDLAQRYLGVVRTGDGLRSALRQLERWQVIPQDRSSHELANLLTLATLIATAALHRENSLGAHYRSDAPKPPLPVAGHLQRFAQQAPTALQESLQAQQRITTLV